MLTFSLNYFLIYSIERKFLASNSANQPKLITTANEFIADVQLNFSKVCNQRSNVRPKQIIQKFALFM